MTLDASGNLGIGTTSPGGKLDVQNGRSFFSANNEPYALAVRYNSSTNGVYLGSPSVDAFVISQGSTGNPYLTINNSGNVGIGTGSPGYKLQVYAASVPEFRLGDATTTFQLYVDQAAVMGTVGSHPLIFRTGATERARIDANGNIICGTAAIATNATNGFLYVPGCAGTPTGTPTTVTGRSPIVVDTTNNKLYFYSGGQWRDAGP
jgi:hypothetical protein